MNRKIALTIFFLMLLIFVFAQKHYLSHDSVISNTTETSGQCDIVNPDPDGYLLKICEYLNKNKDITHPNKKPNEYSVKKIEDGTYSGSNNVSIVRLDCCGTGDLAYFDKETKEVIGFSPGDW